MEIELATALVAVAFGYGIWIGVNILRGREWALEIAQALAWTDPGLATLRSADDFRPRHAPADPAQRAPVDSAEEERLAA